MKFTYNKSKPSFSLTIGDNRNFFPLGPLWLLLDENGVNSTDPSSTLTLFLSVDFRN